MQIRRWAVQLSLTAVCLVLGLLLVVQLRTQRDIRQSAQSEEWEFVVADLVESNARLREEVEAMQAQLAGLRDVEGGGTMLQSLVDEVNHLRITNGLVEVSGPGIEVTISGPISILDLHDLVNELRNAGAEALALNGHRIVAWSAITTDGEDVTVDGLPVSTPYRLKAIGDAQTLEVALLRPGGLVSLLNQANPSASVTVSRQQNLTLPVSTPAHAFAYVRPQE
jgi:uncharacterized protein YlxW (UPF0749 family)